jgi:hypothetical protein
LKVADIKKKKNVEQNNKLLLNAKQYYLRPHLRNRHRVGKRKNRKMKTWDADRRQYHNGTICYCLRAVRRRSVNGEIEGGGTVITRRFSAYIGRGSGIVVVVYLVHVIVETKEPVVVVVMVVAVTRAEKNNVV